MSKRKIKIRYSCSDFSHHEHRYRITAYICGRLQYWLASMEEAKLHRIWKRDIEKSEAMAGISHYEQIFGKDEEAGGSK